MYYYRISLFILAIFITGNLAIGQGPTSAFRLYQQGTDKLQRGDLEAAIRDFTRVIEISSHLAPDRSPVNSISQVNGFDDSANNSRRITVVDPLTANAYT